jgi:hypothetical protein
MANQKKTFQVVRPGNAGQISPEQIAAEHYRAFSQQMQSIAQGILYNMLHNAKPQTSAEGAALVDRALEMAEHYMHAAGPAVKVAFDRQMALADEEAKKEEANKAN